MSGQVGVAATEPYSLLAADLKGDPYPFYHALRAHSPVYFDPKLERWLVTGYAEVTAVMNDPRFLASVRSFSDMPQAGVDMTPMERYLASSMINNDPPVHTRLRGLVNKAFTPRVVEGMRSRIQQVTDQLLDAVQDAGEMDIMRDLAYPLPLIIVSEMLGIEPERRDDFKAWTLNILRYLGVPNPTAELLETATHSVIARNAYLRMIADRRRAQPQADLISELVQAEDQGDRLSEDELYATCGILMTAGHETTSNLIGSGVLALLRHPDQLARLRENPQLIASAIEEFLRYDGPAQWMARVAAEDVVLGPARIGKGQMVLVGFGAANRDPAQFSNPDALDIGRSPNRHLSFGHGIHFCLGAALARLEAPIAITTLLHRMPNLRLAGPEPEWLENFRVRNMRTLPVVF